MGYLFGPVYESRPGYPGMYPLPKPRQAPRVPTYFPRMKVRGNRRRQKWAWDYPPVIQGIRATIERQA